MLQTSLAMLRQQHLYALRFSTVDNYMHKKNETELNVQAWREALLQHFQMVVFSFNF